MGGDGGVIASNRRYMRGAGAADHTGDGRGEGTGRGNDDARMVEREESSRTMLRCSLTNEPLPFHPMVGYSEGGDDGDDDEDHGRRRCGGGRDIVACPYGRLYRKEAAIEALLRRKTERRRRQQQQNQQIQQEQDEDRAGGNANHPPDGLGDHVRGLKDLHEVRFHVVPDDDRGGGGGGKRSSTAGASATTKAGTATTTFIPACPITGLELNGQIPAVALVPGKSDRPNVLSERAVREMGGVGTASIDRGSGGKGGSDADPLNPLLAEYGPVERTIRLAPPPSLLDEIKVAVRILQENERTESRREKKKTKKRSNKRSNDETISSAGGETDVPTTNAVTSTKRSKASKTAQSSVSAAVRKNPVLQSLFSSGADSNLSDQERNNRLFAG